MTCGSMDVADGMLNAVARPMAKASAYTVHSDRPPVSTSTANAANNTVLMYLVIINTLLGE